MLELHEKMGYREHMQGQIAAFWNTLSTDFLKISEVEAQNSLELHLESMIQAFGFSLGN